MRYPSIIAATTLITAQLTSAQADDSTPPASPTDIIRFSNSDTIHGTFIAFGKKNRLLWKSDQAPEAIPFSTEKIHRVILNHGKAHLTTSHVSTLSLINGDIIPGIVTSADKESITLKTHHLGTISLPSNTVSQITLNPHGGKPLYYGPLNTDGWKIISPPSPKISKPANPIENPEKAENKHTDWTHITSAWYAGTHKNSYLTRENALPDKCRLAFKLGWRGSLYCNVAIHADFKPPEYNGTEPSHNSMAAILGHAYVVSITPHSVTLYSCSFDENGKPLSTRFDATRSSLNLSRKQEANFEFRIDRPNKLLLLYINGDFKTKWNLGEQYLGTGSGLSFRNLRFSNSELRISDILIAPWNGMQDSARSMRTDQQDVILLTNGVDRFSGTLKHIRQNKVSFRGTYNNDLTIPIDEVQEIHIASNKLRKIPEQDNKHPVYFYTPPHGRISGTPNSGKNNQTELISDILGQLYLNTRYINIIDFSHQNNLLDFWDDNF